MLKEIKNVLKKNFIEIILFLSGYVFLILGGGEIEHNFTNLLKVISSISFYVSYIIVSIMFYLYAKLLVKNLKKILNFKNKLYKYYSLISLGALAGFLTKTLQIYIFVMFDRII